MSSKKIVCSICIPHVFMNISEQRIRAIFYSLQFGFVERVDMVPKTNRVTGEEIFRVFVHFSSWNASNPDANRAFEQLEAGEKVKIVYDKPWYWMISKSRARPSSNKRRSLRPFIDFEHATVSQPPQLVGETVATPTTVSHTDALPTLDEMEAMYGKCGTLPSHPIPRNNATSPSEWMPEPNNVPLDANADEEAPTKERDIAGEKMRQWGGGPAQTLPTLDGMEDTDLLSSPPATYDRWDKMYDETLHQMTFDEDDARCSPAPPTPNTP